MNPENFAEWMRCQGHDVIRTESSYWYNAQSHVLQAFPYHWVIRPAKDELEHLIQSKRVFALRYSTPGDAPQGCISYHVVRNNSSYSLDNLDKRTRHNIRVGLNHCVVRPISLERLAKEGWLLEKDTEERQGRHSNYTERAWHWRCTLAAEIPGFEAWGAFCDGQLVASLLLVQIGDCCEFLSQQSHRDYIKYRINHALTYEVTRAVLQRPGIRSIFYSLQSLDAPDSVDEFKFRMGYSPVPVRQHVCFHPWLEPLSNPLSHSLIVNLRKIFPKSYHLAKGSGMLRFNMQGKLALARQDWPNVLDPYRLDMLGLPGGSGAASLVANKDLPENDTL